MKPFEVNDTLNTFWIIYDTREQPTDTFKRRIEDFGCTSERRKLDFGDYTAACRLQDGTEYCLEKIAVIERKESLSELCMCYTKDRERFTREFERAARSCAKTYLLVEKASWEKIYNGTYRSQMKPAALVGSLTTWLARYNCQLLFCQADTSGHLIRDVLYHEMKEQLTSLERGEENFDASKFF